MPRVYKKAMVKGIGVNDAEHTINVDKNLIPAYSAWLNMMRRCYDPAHIAKYPTYAGCSVCDEWLHFSNFERWFANNYRDGYDLDKGILKRGNKVYCPEYCAYVPKKINYLFCKSNAKRGEFPIGVSFKGQDKRKKRFKAYMLVNRSQVHLGYYDNPDDAFLAYKGAKEDYIKAVAEECFYNGEIDKRVYDALMKYEVQLTD